MGLLLGILAESKSYYNQQKHEWINYCNMKQYVYMDIGFETGVPMGRILIEIDTSTNKSLAEVFVQLARGEFVHPSYMKPLRYTNSPFHFISSTKNILMGGDVLYQNGCGGCAPTNSGLWVETNPTQVVDNTRGKVVLLSSDSDPTTFNSIFYILTESSGPTIVDGSVIGDVIQGMDLLENIILDYGSDHGIPEKKLIIHQCGHY